VTRVIVTPQARRDVDEAVTILNLPGGTWTRIARSLRVLETFPLAGAELTGRWASSRFLLGPWSWMILLYRHDEASDQVHVVAVHDARSVASVTAARP
jgi:plasmid stabilization system protein ParE